MRVSPHLLGHMIRVWLKHSQPPTHQVIQPVTGLFTYSYLIYLCVYLSKAESVSQSDLHMVYMQIMLASSLMEGNTTYMKLGC